MAKQVKARALVDVPGTDIKSGEFFIADENIVAGLVKAGDADDKANESDVYGKENVPKAKSYAAAAAAAE